ncbi:MAG: spore coat protein [Clostridia bacterium]|nr:spore coat protein [Clostridia bacterium]
MNNTATAASFTDQDRMEDLIAQEKYLIDGYSTFIPEATCPQLRQVLSDNLNGCCNNQYTVYDKMSQLGWYPIKNASQAEIDEAKQKFSQLKQKLG